MRKRMMKVIGILACGCSFQLYNCQSEQVGQIVVGGVRDTTVAVTTFAIESAMNRILGLE